MAGHTEKFLFLEGMLPVEVDFVPVAGLHLYMVDLLTMIFGKFVVISRVIDYPFRVLALLLVVVGAISPLMNLFLFALGPAWDLKRFLQCGC